MAHQLAELTGWLTVFDSPVHAVVVNARNQTLVRPVGDDMSLTFKSGNGFSTGGSGLASNSEPPAHRLLGRHLRPDGRQEPVWRTRHVAARQVGLRRLRFCGRRPGRQGRRVGFLSAFQGTPPISPSWSSPRRHR
ncbi:MAG: hypothetical protein R2705_06645 [Ilumatobacteraceae bacterium]